MATNVWNKQSSKFQDAVGPAVSPSSALYSTAAYWVLGVLSAYSYRLSPTNFQWLAQFTSGTIVDLLCWAIASIFFLKGASVVYQWRQSRQLSKRQNELKPEQRNLLGIPTQSTPSSKPPLPVKPAAVSTPITPPQRYQEGLVPGSLGSQPGWAASPSTGGPGSRVSPSSRNVATPEQLRQVLDSFARDTPDRGGLGAQVGTDAFPRHPGYGSGYGTPLGYSLASMPQQQQQQQQDAGDGGGTPTMPITAEPNLYRPSWLPRKGAAVVSSDGGLQPSSSEELDSVTQSVLMCRLTWFDVWEERLREWLSARVLRPLLASLDAAHLQVQSAFAKVGGQGVSLPPLRELLLGSGGGSGSGAGGGMAGDVEAMVRQYQAAAVQLGARAPVEAEQLARALTRYESLLSLMRGKRPSDLLPPAPAGYLLKRLHDLALGTCLSEFQWSSGGSWGGRPWSADLPTDSALVLYLVAAFTEAPAWDFGVKLPGQEPPEVHRGQPLYLGQVRARPPPRYSAILAYRPEKPSRGVAALLGLSLGSTAPMFALVVEGRYLALSGSHALFQSLLMWLQYHKVKCNGALGCRHLGDDDLALMPVLEVPEKSVTLAHKVFGWWYPTPPE